MAYGMTEGIGLTGIRGDEWLLHTGSVGKGIRGAEVRVLRPDRSPAEVGEVGEIYLSHARRGVLPLRRRRPTAAYHRRWVHNRGRPWVAGL